MKITKSLTKPRGSIFKPILLIVFGGLWVSLTMAGGSGDHKHNGHAEKKHHATGGHHDMSKTHRHDKWLKPPKAYANKKSNQWSDQAAIERGKKLYQAQCASCHGADGKGTGPVAKALAHPPADLSNHFHRKPGDGDAYLFWRVSEGGVVEPFKSTQSAMPAFKGSLEEGARWDVLSYIHNTFHLINGQWMSGHKSENKHHNDEERHDDHKH